MTTRRDFIRLLAGAAALAVGVKPLPALAPLAPIVSFTDVTERYFFSLLQQTDSDLLPSIQDAPDGQAIFGPWSNGIPVGVDWPRDDTGNMVRA